MTLAEERRWWQAGFQNVVGVDEAGRGPLAGPVVAAAVVFDQKSLPKDLVAEVRDSKKLTALQRSRLYMDICTHARSWGVAGIGNGLIDKIGILTATKRAMRSAIQKISVTPDILLIDAVSLNTYIPQYAIVHGDDRVFSIAAASILAKVTRDRLMDKFARRYTQFSFQKHRGYGTKLHMRELRIAGPSPIHRLTFAPMRVQGKRAIRRLSHHPASFPLGRPSSGRRGRFAS